MAAYDRPMKTDPSKEYNIRNMDEAHGSIDGWVGCRKNGSLFLKRFRGGASIYKGGSKLDCALHEHPNFKVYEV